MVQRSLTDEKKKQLVELFEDVNPETNKPYTLDELAAATELPTSTIGRFRKKWEEEQAEAARLETAAINPDVADVFKQALLSTPGLNETKARFLLDQVERTPSILRNPQELWEHLTHGLGLKEYYAKAVLRSVMESQPMASGAPPFFGAPPNMPGGASFFQSPMNAGMPFGAPAAPWAPPSPYPVFASPYGPWMPPQYPPPPPTREASLSKVDVAEMMDKYLAKYEERLRHDKPPDVQMEEWQEPLLDSEGAPRLDPEGRPILVYRRRPVERTKPVEPGLADQLARLKEAGILGETRRDDGLALVLERMQEANNAILSKVVEGQNNLFGYMQKRDEDQVRAMLERQASILEQALNGKSTADPQMAEFLRAQSETMNRIQQQLASEQARREEANIWGARLDVEREARLAAQLAAQQASAGLPADAQIISRALEVGERALVQAQNNQGARAQRLERLGVALLAPVQPNGLVPEPVSASDLEAVAAAQARIDMAEHGPPSLPDEYVTLVHVPSKPSPTQTDAAEPSVETPAEPMPEPAPTRPQKTPRMISTAPAEPEKTEWPAYDAPSEVP